VLSGIGRPLVNRLAEVKPVVQHPVEVAFLDRLALLVQAALLSQLLDEDLW
jgi:hypothetical protein